MENETSYPLQWPVGVPRSRSRELSAFANRSIAQASKILANELRLLGAAQVIISCNLALRKTDGMPKSDQRALDDDPGMAVYFTLKGRRICMPCDKWRMPADNLYAIAKHIESMRGQNRWGVGSVEQAFSGYQALPAPTQSRPWWVVLGFQTKNAITSPEQLKAWYRRLSMERHPDNHGSNEAMAELNQAYAEAKKELGY